MRQADLGEDSFSWHSPFYGPGTRIRVVAAPLVSARILEEYVETAHVGACRGYLYFVANKG